MISSELRDKVAKFVESSMAVGELEEWLVPRLPGFLCDPDSADSNVVAAIELGLAEISSGIQTIAEFRNELRYVLQELTQPVWYFADWPRPMEVRTSSSNQTEDSLKLSFFSEVAIAAPQPLSLHGCT